MVKKIKEAGAVTARNTNDGSHIKEVAKKPRKSRAKPKTAPAIVYKAPGAHDGFLSTMLTTVSRDTVAFMYEKHNPVVRAQRDARFADNLRSFVNEERPPRLAVRP